MLIVSQLQATRRCLGYSNFSPFFDYFSYLLLAQKTTTNYGIEHRFYRYWDDTKELGKRGLENRTRGQLFKGLHLYVLDHPWFGVPQSVEADSDDEDEDSIAKIYQHAEECLSMVEQAFQRVASATNGKTRLLFKSSSSRSSLSKKAS